MSYSGIAQVGSDLHYGGSPAVRNKLRYRDGGQHSDDKEKAERPRYNGNRERRRTASARDSAIIFSIPIGVACNEKDDTFDERNDSRDKGLKK